MRRLTKTSLGDDPRDNIKLKQKSVAYYRLFRFLSVKEKLWLTLALIAALIASACVPALNILFGEMAELMVDAQEDPLYCNGSSSGGNGSSTTTPKNDQKLLDQMAIFSVYMVGAGVIMFITGYVFVSTFCRLAEIQMYRLRIEYLRALLRQDISWYDTVEDRDFVSKISENVIKVRAAVGETASMCMFFLLSSIMCLGFALWYGWFLTLVVLFSSSPVIAISSAITGFLQSKLATKQEKSYSDAGMVAQEALSNIKTVMAFSGQQKEAARYEKKLAKSLRAGRIKGVVTAFGNGFLWFLNYATCSLVLWYGSQLIFDGRKEACTKTPEYNVAALTVVFFNVIVGSFNFGQALSYLEVFSVGRVAAASIYNVIDRIPQIDIYDNSGTSRKERLKGMIEFKHVRFCYPSRKDVIVLDDINLEIHPATTVALVGNSGCGKSTCLQLLQRFYDPDRGSVIIDGTDIRELNINWYRSHLGVVSQEPVLFNETIAENVRYGKKGATQHEIEEACKLANAHAFISRLPKKYKTMVGERGAQLSGGQKQRIAIARALVRNPAILLLDEATSALDTHSEAIVQEAIDRASEGRTTLIVAHRLSTIRKADMIIAIKNGQVAEIGTHESLMSQQGFYYHLVVARTGEVGEQENVEELMDSFTSIEPPEDQEIVESVIFPPLETELVLEKQYD